MGTFIRRMKAVTLLTSTAAIGIAGSACAQDAPGQVEKREEVSRDDIVVTANRVETRISRTAAAVTAISGEGLRDAGVTQPTNLVERVPGIEINRSRGGLNITMRGVASSDTSEKGDSSSAFLLDGVYIARAPMQDVSFYDLARVEVLRGPQGTLYGRNTTAGLINVISNRPTFDFGGSLDAVYGNFGTVQGTGVINVPVSGNFALRAAANYERSDTPILGGPNVDPSYKKFREIVSGRLSGLFTWGSGEILVRADYSDIGGSNFNSLPLGNFYDPPAGLGVDAVYTGAGKSSRELRTLDVNVPWRLYRHNNTWGVAAEITQELGFVNAYYSGSYREMARNEQGAIPAGDLVNTYRSGQRDRFQQQSHELRFALADAGPLQLQAGAYYFKEKSDVQLKVNVGTNTTRDGEAGPTLLFDLNPTKAQSYAFFAQGTYALTEGLRVTGGIRYTHDRKSRVGYANLVCINNFFNCSVPDGAVATQRANAKFSKTTWKVTAEYDVAAQTMLYATVATGYKAGGFNDGCVTGTAPGCTVPASVFYFNPETLTSYEAGIKARVLRDAVQVSASAFHYDYGNLQQTQVFSPCPATPDIPTSACGVTTAAAKAKVDGFELEAVVRPSQWDRADFSVAYLDARYDNFEARPGFNLAGKPLDRAPNWVVTAGYQHTFPLGGDYELEAGVRTRLSDSYVLLYLDNLSFYRQPSFTKTDATLTLNAPQRAWYVQAFVKNIEDSIAVNNTSVGSFPFVNISDPRTYGVRAGVKF